MEEADYGVVYDVVSRNFQTHYRRSPVNMESDKVIFGGPLTVDLMKEVGSLGEHILNCLRKIDPDRIAFVSLIFVISVTIKK